MHIQDALQRALQGAIEHGREMCLLVDTAHAEGSYKVLDRWQIPYQSLFEETPEATLIEIAPLLISVKDLDQLQRDKIFKWVEDLAYVSPCFSWFETAWAPNVMAEHLRLFHVVGLSEGQAMLMRWYDTRILPVWFACLTEPQAEAFAAGVEAWLYVDRTGAIAELPITRHGTDFPAKPDHGQPLICLTDTQYAPLVDAAELDALLTHLRRIIPDELKRVSHVQLTLFAGQYQQQAISEGLDDIDRQAQYVLLALYTSGEGQAHPAFKLFIEQPPASLDAFSDGLQALPDEVWEAGQPMWNSLRKQATQNSQMAETRHA
jgi:hypothetical protein